MPEINKSERSRFAEMLLRLIDETNLFTRAEWAEILDVSEAAISQWVNDKTLPRPELLRMIVDTVKRSNSADDVLTQLSVLQRALEFSRAAIARPLRYDESFREGLAYSRNTETSRPGVVIMQNDGLRQYRNLLVGDCVGNLGKVGDALDTALHARCE